VEHGRDADAQRDGTDRSTSREPALARLVGRSWRWCRDRNSVVNVDILDGTPGSLAGVFVEE
jgi:hypothetical protein